LRIIRFYDASNTLKVQADLFDDLYLLQRILAPGDIIESRSFRRYKSLEGDKGEQKEVFLTINMEKSELDKNASRLRITGKIINGRPEEFVKLNSYHTISVAPGDVISISKQLWKDYIIRRIKEAVADTKKVRFGAIALDDEKATAANIHGYGIDVTSEIYSHLSKRMSTADYEKARNAYFNELISIIKNMDVDMVLVAGPGFTRENFRKYIEAMNISIDKKLLYVPASDAERSGIREAMQDEAVAKFFEHEHTKKEFHLFNMFMNALHLDLSFYGVEQVKEALANYTIGVVLVNDTVLNEPSIQEILDIADMQHVSIEIFNASDEAGMQLSGFKDIAGIAKSIMSK
jgi:protein pelota